MFADLLSYIIRAMQDITIRQGSRLDFSVQRADPVAISATAIFSNGTYTFSDTVLYDIAGLAYFDFGSPETDTIGEFDYQVNENFATGSPDIYPDLNNCDGDCELPKLIICESLPTPEETS